MPRSSSSLTTQTTSAAVAAIALNFASELDLDTVPYFLDLQAIGEFPNTSMYPVTDLLESMQAPQSLLEKACKVNLSEPLRVMP